MECDGAEISKGRFSNIVECSLACKGVSTMFIYGSGSKCNKDGCTCWCETSALSNGTCTYTPIPNYNLYTHNNLEKGRLII